MDADRQLYFIEMNTRIQVEHPVTENVTGIDLVKAQLRIASGEKLETILPAKLEIRGHAIECRINAEHPQKFTPSAGKITAFNVPGGNGVRVDTAQYAEGVVPPYYDSLIAKLIIYGVDRNEAIARMQRALSQFVVQGIETSITLHEEIFADADSGPGSSIPSLWSGFWQRRQSSLNRAQATVWTVPQVLRNRQDHSGSTRFPDSLQDTFLLNCRKLRRSSLANPARWLEKTGLQSSFSATQLL